TFFWAGTDHIRRLPYTKLPCRLAGPSLNAAVAPIQRLSPQLSDTHVPVAGATAARFARHCWSKTSPSRVNRMSGGRLKPSRAAYRSLSSALARGQVRVPFQRLDRVELEVDGIPLEVELDARPVVVHERARRARQPDDVVDAEQDVRVRDERNVELQ